VTPRCEHECFFDFLFSFACDGWQSRATCLYQVLHEARLIRAETLEMLREVFGKHSLNRTEVFEWRSRFKAGRMSVEDDDRLGRPNTSKRTENVETIRELIHEDPSPSNP
jgi:hypothetical protein